MFVEQNVLTRLTPLPLSSGTHNWSNVSYKIALTLHGFVACRLLQLHGATVVAVAPFVRSPTTCRVLSLSLSLSLSSRCRLRTPHVASGCFSATFCFSSHAFHKSKQQRLLKLYRLKPYKLIIISFFSDHRQLLLLIFFLIFSPESKNTISSSTLCTGSCSFFFVFFFCFLYEGKSVW